MLGHFVGVVLACVQLLIIERLWYSKDSDEGSLIASTNLEKNAEDIAKTI